MFEREPNTAVIDDSEGVARIRLKADGIEAFAAPGGSVRVHDKTGRQIVYVGLPPQSTRFLSLKGLSKGIYKVELESLTGCVAFATYEA